MTPGTASSAPTIESCQPVELAAVERYRRASNAWSVSSFAPAIPAAELLIASQPAIVLTIWAPAEELSAPAGQATGPFTVHAKSTLTVPIFGIVAVWTAVHWLLLTSRSSAPIGITTFWPPMHCTVTCVGVPENRVTYEMRPIASCMRPYESAGSTRLQNRRNRSLFCPMIAVSESASCACGVGLVFDPWFVVKNTNPTPQAQL